MAGFKILGTGVDVDITGTILDIFSIAQVIKKQTPTLEDYVVVEVVGQPGANKQQLYYLAMATAFGIVRQYQIINSLLAFITPSYGMLMSEDDSADNWVRCTVKYEVGMYGAVSAASINKLFGIPSGFGSLGPSIFDQLTVYRGPQCSVNGGTFNFVATPLVGTSGILSPLAGAIPGIPTSPSSAAAPKLPFAGQPILTSCPITNTPSPLGVQENPAPTFPLSTPTGPVIPSPNPKPPGDNRSRGVVQIPSSSTPTSGGGVSGIPGSCCNAVQALIPLVFAALSAPGTNSDMTFPSPTPGPSGG